jgi:hypothetical protein
MTQKEKELLLKDLCSRLPYGVKGNYQNSDDELLMKVTITYGSLKPNGMVMTGDIKPYLLPLSSMTEEQKNEIMDLEWSFDNDNSRICNILECFGTYRAYVDHTCCSELIDWLNKNHFDYRGLIERGLAIDATGLNIY